MPPVFSSTRTSVMTAAGSTALIMSMRASAATLTEVSASISTPVRSAVRAVAVMSTPSSVTARSTVTPCSPIGWHSGIRSGVRLAPWMPAIRATASASPLGTSPARSAATAAADSRTRPDARAVRALTSLPETSTIRACPAESRCVSSGAAPLGSSRQDQNLGAVPLVHLDHPLGHDDQRVGPAQGGDLVRTLAGQRGDRALGRVQHPAQVGPAAGR